MEKIQVNKAAAQKTEDEVYERCLTTIKELAAKGQEYMTVGFDVPNYSNGNNVIKRLEEHGIMCIPKGLSTYKQSDGSYFFNICFTCVKDRIY
jgi:hypothetical protein